MRRRLLTFAAAAAALTLASAVQAQAPARPADTAKGKVLVDSRGMTLYTFDRDAAGKSACNGPCAANWPPLAADAAARDAGDWSVITRDDGSRQWAYRSKPLYAWSRDAKPGDVTGDGFNGVWRVATP